VGGEEPQWQHKAAISWLHGIPSTVFPCMALHVPASLLPEFSTMPPDGALPRVLHALRDIAPTDLVECFEGFTAVARTSKNMNLLDFSLSTFWEKGGMGPKMRR